MVDLKASISVKDIMSKTPIVASEDATISEIAKIMADKDVGSVIIVRDGKPVGIITERDIIIRVLAKKLNPDEVKVKDVMSSPIIVISPDADIAEAARKMAQHDVRRLIVTSKGEFLGVVTERDVLATAPELIEILREAAKIARRRTLKQESLAGYCDNCEEWSDNLKEVDGRFLCEECRAELGLK
ncbi:MAG: hypothetical protein DRJ31_01275 [Candidatus Methanomethylicota archaeon]|uniref:CBS domain-containing protein n=1 Tax=Thermoproteota archaeon TaxID=2056631 RepID=A0A497ET10_9CREN|nr:MAG: hypothetical protein DRJ31_01275 [Candidatus Verstraetearchaeota archaeon]